MATQIANSNGEIFTFKDGMVDKISSTIITEIDENIIPQSGPMSNLGIDINGVIKSITITGNLFDADSTVLSTQDIRDKEVMKFWLEALQNGNQSAVSFSSNYEYSSVSGNGTITITDSISGATITLRASFASTKVYVKQITFDEEEANPSLIPFSITLWVAGS